MATKTVPLPTSSPEPPAPVDAPPMNLHDLADLLEKQGITEPDLEAVKKLFADAYPYYWFTSSDPLPVQFRGGLMRRLADLFRERHIKFDEDAVAKAFLG